MCGWRWQNSTNKTSCNWISEYICIICYATDIPDFCHFFYTHTFSGLKILHSKVRKSATKIASRQIVLMIFVNYTVSVKLHSVCKITQCVCKITHCVWNNTMCTKLHIFNWKKIPLSWKILHWRRGQRGRLISAVATEQGELRIGKSNFLFLIFFILPRMTVNSD